MVLLWEKLYGSFCSSQREHATNVVNFEKNVTANKEITKITSRCNGMLHLWKKFLKKVC